MWKGWAKYMVYKTPTSPSPTTVLCEAADTSSSSRLTSPFTLKFRVVQTEKSIQTDLPNGSTSTDCCDSCATGTGATGSAYSSLNGPLAISSPFLGPLPIGTGMLMDDGDVWKFDAEAVCSNKEILQSEDDDIQRAAERDDCEEEAKEDVEGLLNEIWNVTVVLDTEIESETFVGVAGEEEEHHHQEDEEQAASGCDEKELEFDLDELWNPFMSDGGGGEDQVDVCEWIPQAYIDDEDAVGAADEDVAGLVTWADVGAESWPPPNIPIEYLDDEFFDEIYGSLDSKLSEPAGGSVGAGGSAKSRRHCRRRRRNSQKQAPVQRRRPCSFFVEGECRRPDCKFSHDLAAITCRFWIESACFKGERICS